MGGNNTKEESYIYNNKNILFHFKMNNKNDQDSPFNFRDSPIECVYIISGKDFNNIINYLKELNKDNNILDNEKEESEGKNTNKINNVFNPEDIHFYTELKELKDTSKNELDYCIIKEDILKVLKIDNDLYKDKNVSYFVFGQKHFLLFKDNEFLEIKKNVNVDSILSDENVDVEMKLENSKKSLIKKLILLYANEKNINNMLKTNIKDEYDFNEYYLINKQWIENFKYKCSYKIISKKLDEMNLNLSYKGYVLNSEIL